ARADLAQRRRRGARPRLPPAALARLPALLLDLDPRRAPLVRLRRRGAGPLADGVHQLPAHGVPRRQRVDRRPPDLPALRQAPPRPLAVPLRALELPAGDRSIPARARSVLPGPPEPRPAAAP